MQSTPNQPETWSRHGLSSPEAKARLALEGPNELPSEKSVTFFRSVLSVVSEPMFLLLLGAGALYLVLGSLADALTLLAFVVVMIGLTLYQQRKTERAVSRLKDLTAPLAHVMRDNQECAVPTREIVRGDLVLVREGDRIPADASVVECTNLRVDESLLTGESVPVDKLETVDDAPLVPPGSDGQSSVYGGTLVVQGRGLCSVRATGPGSAIGRIGASLSATELLPSALKLEVDQIVRRIALIGAGLCVCLVLAYGIMQGDYLRGLLAGITLAMAILPEEFPVVLTVFTTLGAFRIAKHKVLARRAETIESLGSATVLCVDKTGTITENRMRIAELWAAGGTSFDVPEDESCTLPEEVHEVLEYGVLGSQPDSSDPMERAFHSLGQHALAGTEHLHHDYTREQEYPLTRSLLAVSHLFRTASTSGHVVAAKGAPEAIADLCHLDAAGTERVLARAAELGRAGLRVLAVARADYAPVQHPVNPHDFEFRLLGLVGLEDPVRASVPAAVADFRRAFVRVVMITGDHVETALAIAKQAGLDVTAGVVTGARLAELGASELAATVKTVNVFARCIPEHKLLLVRALQSAGELVAMTGDGVNDAPALKAAQIGVAMGLRGTDVAREAAALVLTTEDFGAIAQAIVLGRRIFENLRKAMSYVLAVHVPIAGMALAPVLMGLPPMLFPVHVVFLELVIDPACSVALEAEEPDPSLLSRPPRAAGEALFTPRTILQSLAQGMVLFLAVLGAYVFSLHQRLPGGEARAVAFITLVVGNVTLILVQRSTTRSALRTLVHGHNLQANLLSLAALSLLAATITVPALRTLFHFSQPPLSAMAAAVAAALAAVLWYDLVKLSAAPPGRS